MLLFAASLVVVPSQTATATQGAPNTIIYNLYATDGFIPLADGSAVYNYGFVGGRQGQPLTYQNSVTPASGPSP